MGDWYPVVKTIKGKQYRYLQQTYRVGGRVYTRNRYLGRVDAGASGTPAGSPTADLYKRSHAELSDSGNWETLDQQGMRGFPGVNGRTYKDVNDYISFVPKEYRNTKGVIQMSSPTSLKVPSRISATEDTVQGLENTEVLQPVIVRVDTSNGFSQAIVVDGYHRVVSAQKAGRDKIPVFWIDEDGSPIKNQLIDFYKSHIAQQRETKTPFDRSQEPTEPK
jgi:hypothetical protein